jgi:predicted transcriptional regulator of viral defense system
MKRLLEYASRMRNGAIFKRLGFLLERARVDDSSIFSPIRQGLTGGNAKLDPMLPAERLITRWRLWVPKNWAESKRVGQCNQSFIVSGIAAEQALQLDESVYGR